MVRVLRGQSFLHIPSPPVFAYLRGVHKASSDDAGQVSMTACTENLLMKLACSVAPFLEDHSTHSFGFAHFHCHHGCFIAPLVTGISADLSIVGQYDVIRKTGFNHFFKFFALHSFLGVCWANHVDVEYLLLVYNIVSAEVSSLVPSPVANRQRAGSEVLMSFPGRDVVGLPDFAYASMESCCAHQRTAFWRDG